MKIDINDPRITAFALGELEGSDAVEIARAVHQDARIRAAVDEVRETSFLLTDSLGGGGALLLTSSQRQTVRSAGASPVIEDIASARVPVWKRPLVAGIGVAAVVALTLYAVRDRPVGSGSSEMADSGQRWDWSQVETDELTAPVRAGVGGEGADGAGEAARAVAAAMSDDTESFRQEVAKRIARSELRVATQQTVTDESDWLPVDGDQTLSVPLVSGVSSWPWLQRYLKEKQSLPPQESVRIEEWVNHFRYQTPSQLTGSQLVADAEMCSNPWNPSSQLLAVHIAARPGVELEGVSARLKFSPVQVSRVRMLGYGHVEDGQKSISSSWRNVSKSQGNYVLYEIELADSAEETEPVLILELDQQNQLPVSSGGAWIYASQDMRFASLVAATAMMASDYGSTAELDAEKLRSLAKIIELQDAAAMSPERREGLRLLDEASNALIQKDKAGEK